MLEYKRDWERISTKAEKVEKEWKDSHAKLSEIEACWARVSFTSLSSHTCTKKPVPDTLAFGLPSAVSSLLLLSWSTNCAMR